MSQVMIDMPDDIYAKLATKAAEQGQTLEEYLLNVALEAFEEDVIKDEIELDPNDPLMQLAGIVSVPVEPGWADKHDYYFADGNKR